MRRLGLGPDDAGRQPGVVYASASGFGQDGPLAALPGLDIMAQARGGLMSITGTPDGAPAKVGVPLCDLVCGLYTALAVTAALRERDRSGEGQYVDVSLLESGVSLAVWEAGTLLRHRRGRAARSARRTRPRRRTRRCAPRDGWVTLGAITPPTWAGMCAALGLEDLRDDARFRDSSSRHALPRRAGPGHRGTHVALDDAPRWSRDWRRPGVPCAPIADYGEVFTDEHLAARDFFWDAPHPVAGPVRQIGSPMRFSRHAGHDGRVPARCWAPTPARRCARPATATTRSTRWWRRARRGEAMTVSEDLEASPGRGRRGAHGHLRPARAAQRADLRDVRRPARRLRAADADDDVRVLVLRGAGGKAFVSGTDIATFRELHRRRRRRRLRGADHPGGQPARGRRASRRSPR